MTKNKEFLYVGHYIDTNGNYILKIGTTNDIKRRSYEHTKNYRNTKKYTMPYDDSFICDWFLPLSKYNTLRYEDSNKTRLINENFGEYIRNDRFNCGQHPPAAIKIKIRKEYLISL